MPRGGGHAVPAPRGTFEFGRRASRGGGRGGFPFGIDSEIEGRRRGPGVEFEIEAAGRECRAGGRAFRPEAPVLLLLHGAPLHHGGQRPHGLHRPLRRRLPHAALLRRARGDGERRRGPPAHRHVGRRRRRRHRRRRRRRFAAGRGGGRRFARREHRGRDGRRRHRRRRGRGGPLRRKGLQRPRAVRRGPLQLYFRVARPQLPRAAVDAGADGRAGERRRRRRRRLGLLPLPRGGGDGRRP